jgi:uncharacterized alkaline shock family protein YloU
MTFDASEATEDVTSCEARIAAPVVAAVAVRAASAVPGVVRLEPGLAGLVGSLVRNARQQLKGLDPAPTEGVRVSLDPDRAASLRLEVDVVTSGQDQVAAVAARVQRAVASEVRAATGLPVSSVIVSIMDIELTGLGSR